KTCAERAGRIGAAAEFEPGEAPGAPAVALSRATLDIAGAFAGAFERLGLGGSALDRTAAATEETARNTRRIAQKMDTGVLAFE
ncbi:MAG: hypothetical protein N3A38_14055, partial [Planctomycetota bacterium]|nr:hypothetical protein [Planctomycetota bacterium]